MTDDEMVEAAILNKQYCRDAVRHAIQMEREACAKVCESLRPSKQEFGQRFYTACTLCANFIRARGKK